MNKKKMKICLVLILVLIECISLTLTIKSFSNRNLEEIKEEHKVNNKKFSMYIKNESGTYVPYNDTNLFPEGYALNLEKSSCVDTNGKKLENVLVNNGDSITITSNKTIYCYLYLDLITDDVTISIKTDGETGVMPSSGAYTNSASCSSGNVTWSDKYQRIEIGNLSKQVMCNLTFTKDTSNKTLLINEVESKGTKVSLSRYNGQTDESYRYQGKEPNNWIWFNNEMWRIMGSVPTCFDSSCNSKDNLVKIIRADSIGGLVFNTSASNTTWGSNTLYTLLNNYYYGKQNGTGTSYCYGNKNISSAVCNYLSTGISNDVGDYYGKMIKAAHWNVGIISNNSTQLSSGYYTETNVVTSSAIKVGIMNVTDYALAATGVTSSMYLSGLFTNWLYATGFECTMTRVSNSSVHYIDGGGYVAGGYEANLNCAVRPVVHLDSSVYIISGDGSITNPYIIGM